MARLNKITLEEFYKTNIWDPLGMTKSTYYPAKFVDSIVLSYLRGEDGIPKPHPLPVPLDPPTETAGHGVWSTPNDFIKLFGVLLGEGRPILSKSSVDEIFKPQCLVPEDLNEMVQGPYKPALGPSIAEDQKIDHGLAGVLNNTAFPDGRPAGVLQWSGMPNLIWVSLHLDNQNHLSEISEFCLLIMRQWVDRKTGIAATTFLQLMPVGDPIAGKFIIAFEKAVYKAFGSE